MARICLRNLKMVQDRNHIPLPLQKGNCDRFYIQEVFGDMLGEISQVIRHLLGTSTKPDFASKSQGVRGPTERHETLKHKRSTGQSVAGARGLLVLGGACSNLFPNPR